MTLDLDLNVKDLDKLISLLEDFEKSLDENFDKALDALMDKGIEVAKQNVPQEWSSGIVFEKQTLNAGTRVKRYALVAKDASPVFQEWLNSKGERNGYYISPLYLSEFGSGWLADVKTPELTGVFGQGTMPNAKGHAFDYMGWSWYDAQGNYHRSIGVRPTYPMYKALSEMINQSDKMLAEIAKKLE